MHAEIYYPVITAEMKRLPLYITTIGTTLFEKYMCRPNGMNDFQLLYSGSGEGAAKINGETCSVPAGSVLFLPPGCRHDYHAVGGKWVTHWVTFNGSCRLFDFKPAVYSVPPELDIKSALGEIIRLRETPQWRIKSSAMLYELLLKCGEYMSETAAVATEARLRISPCMDYIEKHFAEVLELRSMAAATCVSEEHLCRMFRSSVGMRPFEYINSFRVQRAKELLALHPQKSIAETGKCAASTAKAIFQRYLKNTSEYLRGNIGKRSCTNNQRQKTLY